MLGSNKCLKENHEEGFFFQTPRRELYVDGLSDHRGWRRTDDDDGHSFRLALSDEYKNEDHHQRCSFVAFSDEVKEEYWKAWSVSTLIIDNRKSARLRCSGQLQN